MTGVIDISDLVLWVWSITPERMVRWRSAKSLRNRLDKGYLLMTRNYRLTSWLLCKLLKSHLGPILGCLRIIQNPNLQEVGTQRAPWTSSIWYNNCFLDIWFNDCCAAPRGTCSTTLGRALTASALLSPALLRSYRTMRWEQLWLTFKQINK